MRNFVVVLCCFMFLSCQYQSIQAASVRKAEIFKEHGLLTEAKKELIDVLFSDASADEKAQAYYILGGIAFNEKRMSTALNTWNELLEKYPNSSQATFVKGKYSVN